MGRKVALGPSPLRRDRRPLYLQAIDAIQQLVAARGLVPGQKLPSEMELGALLGVGRSTIREAMGHLELARVVERRRGVGTVLLGDHEPPAVGLERLESLESLAARQGWKCRTRDVRIRARTATDVEGARLGIEPASWISVITRTKSKGDEPLAEMVSLVPEHVIPFASLEVEFRDSITELMTRRHGPRVRYARAEVTSFPCDAERARRLGLREGDPVLVLDELFVGDRDEPLAWNLLYFVPSGIRLEVIRRPRPSDLDLSLSADVGQHALA